MVIWRNYGTTLYEKKTMVLWKKLRYLTENYGTLIYYGKKTMVLWGENYGTIVNYSLL